jgi:RHS repeat-associated protein
MSQRFTYHIRPSATPFAQTHTFSAKEKDSETGLSVTSLRSVSSFSLSQIQTSLVWHSLMRRFGSRYYSSDLSIWLSVDPMSDKYPSLSPYVYCADNPIELVDPNGEEIVLFVNKTKYSYNGKNFVDKDGNIASFRQNSFESRVLSDLNKLYNSESNIIRGKLNDMMKSKHQHSIVRSTVSGGIGYNKALDTDHAGKYGEGSDTEIGYNPFATKSVCADGGYISCATLAHELLGHGWNNDQGLHESDNHTTENGIKFEEVNAVNIQNKVLVEHHQLPRSLVGSPNDAKQIPVELINHYYTTKPK